jgi:hypothetical protein
MNWLPKEVESSLSLKVHRHHGSHKSRDSSKSQRSVEITQKLWGILILILFPGTPMGRNFPTGWSMTKMKGIWRWVAKSVQRESIKL